MAAFLVYNTSLHFKDMDMGGEVLVRRGEAAGAIADMHSPRAREPEHRYAVYWKGALYVHCQNDSIMRITLSNGEYEVIKPPTSMDEFTDFYIWKSKRGLYCALIYKDRSYRLHVWLLSELRGKMEWGLKIDTSLVLVVAMFFWLSHEENSVPWILHGGNYDGDGKKVIVEEQCEWDFNNGSILETR
uniref:F-box associated domain-containing protein n=1 Tax=Triticum urartu TaxID=4572 RepID=A0A8R7TW45_TRIUA